MNHKQTYYWVQIGAFRKYCLVLLLSLLFGCDGAPYDIYDEGPEIKEQLVKAASEGDVLRVKELLANGHDINVKSKSGYTALGIAVRFKKTGVVIELCNAGASVDIVDRKGLLPLDSAVSRAAPGEYIEIVEALVRAGADPDAIGPKMVQTPREYAKAIGGDDLLAAMERGIVARGQRPSP